MLAIVIPYYKGRFFEQTLRCLVNQTDCRFNVYIGNDASPDSIDLLINEYSKELKITYKSFKENIGSKSLVTQWKRCLGMMDDEEWFIILCDDDFLSENYVQSFYENYDKISKGNYQIVRYPSILISDNGEKISKIYQHPIIENALDSLVRKVKGNTRSSLSEYVFKNNINYENVFIDFPNAYYSDDLSILLTTNFGNIYTINEALFYFRRGEYNLSGVNSDIIKGKRAEFLFYKYLFNNFYELINNEQKKLFLFRLTRQFVYNKSFKVYFFVLKEQIKMLDLKGIFYLPVLFIKKIKNKIT